MAAAASFLFYFCVSPKTFWHSDDLININLATMISISFKSRGSPVWGETIKVKISTYQYKSLSIYLYILIPLPTVSSSSSSWFWTGKASERTGESSKKKSISVQREKERDSSWYSAAILSLKIKDKALTIWLADVTHLASYHIRVFWYACCLYFQASASEHLSV